MKKRLLSWLMVLTLCLTLLPTAAFANFDATPFASEPVWSADIPSGGNGGFSVKFYVTDADGVKARGSFLDKLASCSLETVPQNGAKAVEATQPAPTGDYPAAALVSDLHYDAACGANDLLWTLEMKNGDTIRLRQRLYMNEILVVTYTAVDAPMNTVEELNALLARIEREEDSRVIVALELPPVTYTSELHLESRAYALRGRREGERQPTFTDTVTVGTREPFPTSITGVRFEGGGGDGLAAYEGVFLYDCEFIGWDTAALVCDGGWIGAKGCVFRGNQKALWFKTGTATPAPTRSIRTTSLRTTEWRWTSPRSPAASGSTSRARSFAATRRTSITSRGIPSRCRRAWRRNEHFYAPSILLLEGHLCIM